MATFSVRVTAQEIPVESVVIDQTSLIIRRDCGTGSLTATVNPPSAENIAVVWSTPDSDIVSVDSNSGFATIVATSVSDNIISDSIRVEVDLNSSPEAAFTWSQISRTSPFEVSLNAASSNNNDGDNLTYEWSISGGIDVDDIVSPIAEFSEAGD